MVRRKFGSSAAAQTISPDEARRSQQAAVAELGRIALAGAGLQELSDATTRLLAENLGVEHAGVLELSAEGDYFLVTAGVGWRDGIVGRFRVGSGGSRSPASPSSRGLRSSRTTFPTKLGFSRTRRCSNTASRAA